MSKRNENRPGYKKTPIGWIPEEWNISLINTLGEVITGTTPSKNKLSNYGDSIPWCTAIDMQGKYVIDTTIKLSKEGAKKARVLPQGAVLITCIASIGKNAIAKVPLATNQQINAIIANSNNYNEFIYYALSQKENELKQIAGKTAVQIIPKSAFSKFKIARPSLKEQFHISQIISCWDRVLDQIQKIISVKQHLKKGLLQQLLTGQIRFPEYGPPIKSKIALPKGWKKCRLGDCFNERTETDSDLTLLSITSDRGLIPRDEVERKDSSNSDKSKYKKIVPGDIGYNTMRMWQGVSAVSTIEGIVSPAYTICSPKNGMVSKYFGYLFKYASIIHKFHRYSQGLVDDTLNLKFHNFSQIKVNIPNEDEQKCIAEILSAIDNEIGLLEKELGILVKQKNGLIQKLLTGEVRHPDFIKKQITKEE